MANVTLPNVEGLNTVEELKNAVMKMSKELQFILGNISWKNVNHLRIGLANGGYVLIDNNGITVNNGIRDTFKSDTDGNVNMTSATIMNYLTNGFIKLDDTGIIVNNGTHDTFKVDFNGEVTMTGAKVQSTASEYPRIVMDPDENFYAVYISPTKYVRMWYNEYDAPVIWFNDGSMYAYMYLQSNGLQIVGSTGVSIHPLGSNVRFGSWGEIYSQHENTTLKAELDSIRNRLTNLENTIANHSARISALESSS